MPVHDLIRPLIDDLTRFRRDLHANPELGFQETRTQARVVEALKAAGVDEIHADIARTGVVAVVRGRGGSNRAVGLRADMDALPITEKNGFAHKSVNAGRMHACGHDGHTTMLVGAARHLAANRESFDGTVYLFFQPAEEGGGGGRVMVEEGLFERFPVESVFGMHNMPGLALGEIAMRPGPCMAAADEFVIRVSGKGSHAAMPHKSTDPVVVAAHIITGLQSIVSRMVDPVKNAVVSVTMLNAGTAMNIIPDAVEMKGTCRTFLPEIRALCEEQVKRIATGIAEIYGCTAEIAYHRDYPPTVNSEAETGVAAQAAARVVGEEKVDASAPPRMGAEDFSYMLEKRPGCYIWLGNGAAGEKGGNLVHTAQYDFNDDAIIYGVSYWASLVETLLPPSAGKA